MRITSIFEWEGSVWVWFSYRTPCSDHDCSLRITDGTVSEGDESAFGSQWRYDAETAAREFGEFLPEIMAAVDDWAKGGTAWHTR